MLGYVELVGRGSMMRVIQLEAPRSDASGISTKLGYVTCSRYMMANHHCSCLRL